MVFSSVQFLFVFLPLTLALYYLVPARGKNAVLVAASLLFYAWGGVRYTLLILLSVLVNYLLGLAMERFAARRAVLTVGVLFNLGLLGYFKYFDFFAGSVNALAGGTVLAVRGILLPIGISFYTFQAMSYLIDLYRREISLQHNLLDFALYIALFPQLIAGPIVRYRDIAPNLARRVVTVDGFCYGIKRFVLGLSKKVLLANPLGSVFAAICSVSAAQMPAPILILGYLCYMLQLYYDFSGYSDMAIGLGRMFGFTFPENFDLPYLARSVGELWRRWHMTLSDWFKNYVYIPLGGNRKGERRTCLNLLLVFVLTGLWHGAAWQYVIFGFYQGALVVLERLWLRRRLERVPAPLAHFYTLFSWFFGLLLFGAPNLHYGLQAIAGIFCWQGGAACYRLSQFLTAKTGLFLFLGVLFAGPFQLLCRPARRWAQDPEQLGLPGMALLFALLFCCIVQVTAGTYNPFIYFRF